MNHPSNLTPLKSYRKDKPQYLENTHDRTHDRTYDRTPLTPFSNNRSINRLSAPGSNYKPSMSPYRATPQRREIKDDWLMKQKQSWVNWFNQILNQSTNENYDPKEFLNSSFLEKHQREKVLREKAVGIFIKGKEKLEKIKQMVEMGQISLYYSAYKNIREDIGMKYNLISLILVYNPLYLRIAFEVMFNEILTTFSGTLENSLSKFIEKRVLLCDEISESGLVDKERDKLNDNLNKHTLSLVLSLIWFLDQLKINNTLKFCNSLFISGSKITSSQSFLDVFCKEYITKPKQTSHLLKVINYNLEYKIIPIDEYEFLISSFDEDFRDGVKFTRVAEILRCDDSSLCRPSTNLKIPAVTRQARIHNMKIALLELQKAGVSVSKEEISESALVEGDVLVIMKLLWNIFIVAELPRIRTESIFEEIREINGGIKRFRDNNKAARYNCGIIANLLEWCCSICSRYDIEVRDFDVSFSDGRIYGCLIHYYCPHLLDIKQVLANGDFYREYMNSQKEEEAKKYRKLNEDIIFKAIQEIQFVPWVISPVQVNDKVIITFVAYLFDRLLSLKKGNDTSTLLASLTQKISLLTTVTNED